MPQDRPTAIELLDAVRDFLIEEAMPGLERGPAFHARVAANALAIVARELALAPQSDAAEHTRLRTLCARDGTLADLNAALAQAIRAGQFDDDAQALLAHLRQTAREKLLIANPRYLEEDED